MVKPNPSAYWLYQHHGTVSDVLAKVDHYVEKVPDVKISLLILHCKGDIFKEIKKWKPDGYTIQETQINDTIFSFSLNRSISKKRERKVKGNVLIFRHSSPDVFIALTHESLEFVNLCFVRFFENYFPDVSILHLSSPQLHNILEKVEKQIKCKITADKIVAKDRVRKSSVVYTNEHFEEVFKKTHEDDQWVDKIDFIADKRERGFVPLIAYMSRDGLLRCSSNFKLFYNNIAENTVKLTADLEKLYSDRGRQPKEIQGKPLVIEYTYPVFQDKLENRKLISALDDLKYASYCVFHANPYLNLSVIDYLDGSSFEMWVVSTNRIIISPQTKATVSSIDRLINHLFERFKEGEIKSFEESELSDTTK